MKRHILRPTKPALFAIVALGTVIWVVGLLFVRAVGRAREESIAVACIGSLCQIKLACHLYAADRDGEFPDSLRRLYPAYLTPLRVFACPATRAEAGDLDDIDAWSDYVLVPGRSESDDPDAVLAYCRPGNHGGSRTMVLYVDGRVEPVTSERFAELIRHLPPPPGPDP